MTTKTITSVVSLAGLLKSIFVSGRFKKDLPMQIVDPKGNAVCEIRTEDPERWIRTNYKGQHCVHTQAVYALAVGQDGHCAAGQAVRLLGSAGRDGISGCRL